MAPEENPEHSSIELARINDTPVEESTDDCISSNYEKPDGIGYWGAVAHLIRATVVTGILLLPFVMKSVGYITGSVLLTVVFIVYFHNIHILLYLDNKLRGCLKVPRLTYAIIADEIFSKSPFPINKFRKSLLFLIYIYYIVPTSKSISLVVMSKNIQQIAEYYHIDLNQSIIIMVLVLALTICCMFRSLLKILVPFSSTTDILTFVVAIAIIIYSIRYRDTNAIANPFEKASLMLIIRGMVIFLNAALSAYIIIPLRNDMKEPKHLDGVLGGLNVTAIIIAIFYLGFALIPYFSYGNAVQENILSNIPVSDLLILCINVVYCLGLFVSYILSFYACFDVIWSSKLEEKLADSKYIYIIEYSIRIGFNVLTYYMAVGIADMALISCIGGIIGILLELACIPLLQILLMFILDEKNYWVIVRNVLLIAFSSVFFFVSIVDIVNEVIKII